MSARSCPEIHATRSVAAWRRAARGLSVVWGALRRLSGDDAYERYLAHQRRVHAGCTPLDRDTFWRSELERRWGRGVQRCC